MAQLQNYTRFTILYMFGSVLEHLHDHRLRYENLNQILLFQVQNKCFTEVSLELRKSVELMQLYELLLMKC